MISRICAFLVAGALSVLTGAAQDGGVPKGWAELAPDEGALVTLSKGAFSVEDASGTVLDFVEGKSGQPILSQYRLVPGTYPVQFSGFMGSVPISVRPGEAVLVDLIDPAIKTVVVVPPDQLELLAAKFVAEGVRLYPPVVVGSDAKALYFNRNTSRLTQAHFLREMEGSRPNRDQEMSEIEKTRFDTFRFDVEVSTWYHEFRRGLFSSLVVIVRAVSLIGSIAALLAISG